MVSRILRGVFNVIPALSRYVTITWNFSKVFQYIKTQPTLAICDLQKVSHRLAILLPPTKGQKDQTTGFFNLNCLKFLKTILFNRSIVNHQ